MVGYSVKGLGFPKIRDSFLEAFIKRITIFWGLYWGPPI